MQKRLPTWREMNADTSPEIEEIIFANWREWPAHRKLKQAFELTTSERKLAWERIRAHYPHATDAQLRWLFVCQLYGDALAHAAYGAYPANE